MGDFSGSPVKMCVKLLKIIKNYRNLKTFHSIKNKALVDFDQRGEKRYINARRTFRSSYWK